MKRLFVGLLLGLIPAIGLTVPYSGSHVVAATTTATAALRQPLPDHAVRSRRGGWICDNGYVKRDQSCVRVEAATDTEIRQQMIAESLEAYSGNCPCPHFRDRAGRRCGGRSAYSRPGGASPLCYEDDIRDRAVAAFREQHTGRQ